MGCLYSRSRSLTELNMEVSSARGKMRAAKGFLMAVRTRVRGLRAGRITSCGTSAWPRESVSKELADSEISSRISARVAGLNPFCLLRAGKPLLNKLPFDGGTRVALLPYLVSGLPGSTGVWEEELSAFEFLRLC